MLRVLDLGFRVGGLRCRPQTQDLGAQGLGLRVWRQLAYEG